MKIEIELKDFIQIPKDDSYVEIFKNIVMKNMKEIRDNFATEYICGLGVISISDNYFLFDDDQWDIPSVCVIVTATGDVYLSPEAFESVSYMFWDEEEEEFEDDKFVTFSNYEEWKQYYIKISGPKPEINSYIEHVEKYKKNQKENKDV